MKDIVMTNLDDLLSAFRTSPLSELYVTGYLDTGSSIRAAILPHGESRQFHPIWDEVYLEVGTRLFRCRAIEQYSRLSVGPVSRMECSFPIDPDDTFGVMSFLRGTLQSGRESAGIDRVDLFIDQACTLEACVVAALGLSTIDDEYLFFDPLDPNGIHVGARESRDLWIAHVGDRYRLDSRTVSRPSPASVR